MKTPLSILLCLLLACLAFGSGEERIRKQFVEYSIQQSLSVSTGTRHYESLRDDGTWSDIDYTSQRRGEWPTRVHLDRLKVMATLHADPASTFYQQEALRQAVLNGLRHWIEEDYRNPNWYNERIGVPYRLGSILVLMGDSVPDEVLEAARPILYRSELGLTGQNKVWCAGIGIMKGVLYADHKLLEQAVADVWSELRVSTGEGVQPDWSFHQHGPQQQFGNYGLSFGADMVQWASVLRGTDYALSGEALETLRNYMLEGPSWILWQGRMDFSGLGRHVDEGSQQEKSRGLIRQLESMRSIDPPFAKAYASTGERVGYRAFWRSDMGVQRAQDWYASVKMASTRVIGSESCNSENMLGLHQGDGVLLTYLDGGEYEDLMPLWDWKRLPGTTCDQGFDELLPRTFDEFGGSSFAGALSAGETGLAAMIYQRNQLAAHKAWFFLSDQIVCLGAGIAGETKGEVLTSVEQSWLQGEVKQASEWVWHNKIGYYIMQGDAEVVPRQVEGNWNAAFPSRGDRPAAGEVFSVWIEHGQSPTDGRYAYSIFPGKTAEQMEALEANTQCELLSNTPIVQAIEHQGAVYAAFYEAGTLTLGARGQLETDGPCLIIIEGEQMRLSEPTQSRATLGIKLNAKSYRVELPQGPRTGSQVEVTL